MIKIKDACILIVEDDEMQLELISGRLTEYGYTNIKQATNVDDAKNQLQNNHFDVIIADMRLGNQDEGGFSVLNTVIDLKLSSLVIHFTANDNWFDCRKALKGMRSWDYISKTGFAQYASGSAYTELMESVQTAIEYLNSWKDPNSENWIEDNISNLQKYYSNQYIAVMNQAVIEKAFTKAQLEDKLRARRLPLFAPKISFIQSEVEDMLHQLENERVEFKSSMLWDINLNKVNYVLAGEVLKTICGFLNAPEGGTLLIGVNDNGEVLGLESDYRQLKKKDSDGFLLRLQELVAQHLPKDLFASNLIKAKIIELEGKELCQVVISQSNRPVFLKKSTSKRKYVVQEPDTLFYIRSSNSTIKLRDRELYNHLFSKQQGNQGEPQH